MDQPTLVLEDTDGNRWQLKQATVTIGKGPANDVMISGVQGVSRSHAVIDWTEDGYRVRQADPTPLHPPCVNDVPIAVGASSPPLRPGDRVQIGRMELRVG